MSKKILLVDDSATVLMMERMILAAEHVELSTANNGLEALQKAKAERPDLILMDIVMPHVSGLEACKALRADPVTQHIPIILVTTRGEADNIELGYQNGCNDYVTKPVNSAELLRKVRSYLGGKISACFENIATWSVSARQRVHCWKTSSKPIADSV